MGELLEGRTGYFHPRHKIIYEGGIYHLIQRAPGKEIIFLEDSDYLYFIHILKEYAKRYSLDIFAFALLPNHLHILLRINFDNLSSAMHSLFTKYALYFNAKYERKGHVFYGNYRASLCLDDRYLITLSTYIHLNPFKAGLVQDPFRYQWSSLELFLHPEKKSFVDSRPILEILDKNLNYAAKTYKEILMEVVRLEFRPYGGDWRTLKRVLSNLVSRVSTYFSKREGDRREKILLDEQTIEERIKELKKKNRLRDIKDIEARNYLIQQLKANGYSVKDIAKKLGISRQAIYHSFNLTKKSDFNVK